MLIFNILITMCFVYSSTSFRHDDDEIIFDLNSETVEINDLGSNYGVEVFKPMSNNKYLNKKDKSDQLKWFSFGRPTLLAIENQENPFTFNPKGFYVQVETLTKVNRILVKDELEKKYDIDIDQSQVQFLTPSKFECRLDIECDGFYSLEGQVLNLNEFPLRVYFNVSKNTNELKCLQKIVKENEDDYSFDCSLSTYLKHSHKGSSSLIGRSYTFVKSTIKNISSGEKCLEQFEILIEKVTALEKRVRVLENKNENRVVSDDDSNSVDLEEEEQIDIDERI